MRKAKQPEPEDVTAIAAIYALIASDVHAMQFQTMGQYRSALLRAIPGITARLLQPKGPAKKR